MHGTLKHPLPSAPQGRRSPVLALKLAIRDLSGGIRGFGVFIACLALGVMAIAAVASTSRGLSEGLSREGRRILGGDASFTLTHREATPAERAAIERQGKVSSIATLRGMANAGDKGAGLVEIKAVDGFYPSVGSLATEPAGATPDFLALKNDQHGAIVDPVLLARLGLTIGETILIGKARVELRAALVSEPDKIATGVGFGPRLILSQEALRASDLIQPGSLVRWGYRLTLPDNANADAALTTTLATIARDAPEAGWEVRSRDNAAPQFQRNLERFTQFLTLVGLTALLVGGVGVANGVRRFVEAKRIDFATLKAVGAPGSLVVAIHLTEVMLVAAIGIGIGLVLGAAMPYLLAWSIGAILPLPFEPTLAFDELAIAALYGFLTALVFSILPLGRAHDVPVSALFRDQVEPDLRRPRAIYVALFLAALAGLVAVAMLFSYNRNIALLYIGVMGAVFVLLRLVAVGLMRLAAWLPRPTNPAARLALANVHRPGALTPALVLSLGLGVALLSALAFINTSLTRQLTQNLPDKAPSFFFLDIPNTETARFDAFIERERPGAKTERVPMMRGRIVSLKGIRAEDWKAPEQFGWILEGDRGITYAPKLPDGSVIASGQWWAPDHRDGNLVSFDREIANGLGLVVGDEVVVNVLGRNITARIANLRTIEWRNLGINFVMVFSPNTFAGAPHTQLATLTPPASAAGAAPTSERREDGLLLRNLAREFPAVTAVRVKDALEAVNGVVAQLALAIRGASGLAIASSLLVLAGALAAGQRARLYDAMILKTLGATRARIMGAYALEYAAIGLAAAVFGLVAGALAGWIVVTRVMKMTFVADPTGALLVAFGAVFVSLLFGLAGTLRILSQKPASHLRSL
ncbi:MAG: ABC transporter permease [Bosea sp. (in: a-proteobacteria)]